MANKTTPKMPKGYDRWTTNPSDVKIPEANRKFIQSMNKNQSKQKTNKNK